MRSIFAYLLMSVAVPLWAQIPFDYAISAVPGNSLRCLAFERIETDLYGIAGTWTNADTVWTWTAQFDANGGLSNVERLRCDTGFNGFANGLLRCTDGGLLRTWSYAENGTDKQTFVRTDVSGAVRWARHYPDNYGIFLTDVEDAIAEQGGHTFLLGHRQDVPANVGYGNVLLELDSLGACVALRTWADSDSWSDLGRGLLPTAAGGLFSVSVLRPYSSSATYAQLSVQRWDATLQVAWSQLYSLGNYHLQNHALHLSDDGLLLSGQIRFSSGQGDFYPYFIRLDSTGQVLWARMVHDPELSPSAAVEEPDGTFTVLCASSTYRTVVARLDSAGALIDAQQADGTADALWAQDLLRDTATGEHLVRGYPQGANGIIRVLRLDALLTPGCSGMAYPWHDSLVTPEQSPFPISPSLSTLSSVDTTLAASTGSFTVEDVCHSTPVVAAATQAPITCWPMPVNELLCVKLPEAPQSTPYWIVDATGRTVSHGIARPNGDHLQVDVAALLPGHHVLLLRTSAGLRRVALIK